MAEVLVLYYSDSGNTAAMANYVARGVERVNNMSARLRRVPPVSAKTEASAAAIPDTGPPYAELADLHECVGLVMGSPGHFGNMAAALKYFWDNSSSTWFGSQLAGKPAGVFTSVATAHGGHESTLLSMMIPLLHHGMLLVGLPYSQPELLQADSGGSPYGASHQAGNENDRPMAKSDITLCEALGARVADVARRLQP